MLFKQNLQTFKILLLNFIIINLNFLLKLLIFYFLFRVILIILFIHLQVLKILDHLCFIIVVLYFGFINYFLIIHLNIKGHNFLIFLLNLMFISFFKLHPNHSKTFNFNYFKEFQGFDLIILIYFIKNLLIILYFKS